MTSTFSKLHSKGYRRLILLVAMMTLTVSIFAGCKKEDVPEETNNNNAPPNLIQSEDTTPVETEPEETDPPAPSVSVDGDTATIAVGPVNIQSLAGPDGKVIGHLNAGDQVEILRQVDIDYIHWAMIRDPKGSYGWICMDNLEQTPGGEATPTIPEDPNEDYKPEQNKPVEETKPAENNNQNNNTMSQKGVVTGSELNIRSKPTQDSERVGSLMAGTRVTILEKKDGWGRIKDGWISLKYVYLDGQTGNNTAKGVVITDNLNVRGGPGTNYDRVTSYNAGKRVQILEQITVGDTKWGCTKDGWIAMKYVYVDGTTGENSGKGTVTGSELNIRTGPGTNYDSIGAYNSGDRVDILTQIKIGDMTWGCTSKGWIAMKYVDMDD